MLILYLTNFTNDVHFYDGCILILRRGEKVSRQIFLEPIVIPVNQKWKRISISTSELHNTNVYNYSEDFFIYP